jgi:hypothetical protein
MSVLKTENWDGVTAPGIPSGWNNDANLVTSAAVFNSSPNSLSLKGTASAGVPAYCTWGTADGVGGNVVVQALCQFGSNHANWWGVAARGNMAQLNNTSTSQYVGWLAIWPNYPGTSPKIKASISLVQAGVETVLATISGGAPPATGAWHLIRLTCNGPSLQLAVQRQSDGFWLNSSATFVSGFMVAVSTTDSTLSGSGTAGVVAQQGDVSQALYSDDWELDSLPPPTWPYLGGYLVPHRPDNREFWT